MRNNSSVLFHLKLYMLSTLYALHAVMKDDNSSSVVFLSQTFILWTKRARRSESFRLLGGWVKIHQIP